MPTLSSSPADLTNDLRTDAPAVAPPATLTVPELGVRTLHVVARAHTQTPPPAYLGTALRGALGHALRRLACTTGAPDCQGCPRTLHCGYGAIWEGSGAGPLGALGRGGDAPRPYVVAWDAPAPGHHGRQLAFAVTLLGRAEQWLPFFILAIRDALATGLGPDKLAFTLDRIELRGPAATQIVWQDGALVPWEALASATLRTLSEADARAAGSRFLLGLETPLSLTAKDRTVDVPTVPLIVQRLVERLERPRRGWDDSDPQPLTAPELAWRELVAMASEVRVLRSDTRMQRFERRSMRAAGPVPMAGVVGVLELAEVPLALAAILAAGAYVHVGKQATFGFGRLQLRPK